MIATTLLWAISVSKPKPWPSKPFRHQIGLGPTNPHTPVVFTDASRASTGVLRRYVHMCSRLPKHHVGLRSSCNRVSAREWSIPLAHSSTHWLMAPKRTPDAQRQVLGILCACRTPTFRAQTEIGLGSHTQASRLSDSMSGINMTWGSIRIPLRLS